jgi:hypothetical protein
LPPSSDPHTPRPRGWHCSSSLGLEHSWERNVDPMKIRNFSFLTSSSLRTFQDRVVWPKASTVYLMFNHNTIPMFYIIFLGTISLLVFSVGPVGNPTLDCTHGSICLSFTIVFSSPISASCLYVIYERNILLYFK